MAPASDGRPRADRRRLHRSVVLHGAAVVVFGLMAWRSVDLMSVGSQALAVPMLIAGAGGAGGALVIVWSLLLRRDLIADQYPPTRVGAQRAARIGMALVAAVTVAVGVALAPAGWERGFVISMNVVTGSLLAVFALLAGERARRQDEG